MRRRDVVENVPRVTRGNNLERYSENKSTSRYDDDDAFAYQRQFLKIWIEKNEDEGFLKKSRETQLCIYADCFICTTDVPAGAWCG